MTTAHSFHPPHALDAMDDTHSTESANGKEILTTTKRTKRTEKRINIQITDENIPSIQSTLNTAQGKAYADVLCAADIVGFAKDAEKALENAGIAASFRKEATYRVQPSGPAANAYRYSRTGTAIVIKRGKSAWALIDVHRISVWPREKGIQKLTLTIDQKLRALNRFMKTFHISATEIVGVLGFSSETDHLHKQIVRA